MDANKDPSLRTWALADLCVSIDRSPLLHPETFSNAALRITSGHSSVEEQEVKLLHLISLASDLVESTSKY